MKGRLAGLYRYGGVCAPIGLVLLGLPYAAASQAALYYVDRANPESEDSNPGTAQLPRSCFSLYGGGNYVPSRQEPCFLGLALWNNG